LTDPDTPTTERPAPASPTAAAPPSWLTQANITTGLAVAALILAAAPYVVPQLQAYQVRSALVSKPAILQDGFEALQAQKAEQAAVSATEAIKAHHDSIFNDPEDPVIGNPRGKIKVVEFLDYLCAYCRAASPQIKDFLTANPDVQIVVKEYPVVHPPSSIELAHIGMAVAKSGHYEEIHYALLDNGLKSEADIDVVLKQQGLDPVAVRNDAKSGTIESHVAKTVDLGTELKINGTPTFIVGDKMINGADLPALQAAVAAQRKAG